MIHQSRYRVYYEDTDAGGVMYYANYLKFAERARTDALRSGGIRQSDLLAQGTNIVVRACTIDYMAPARLDDLLTIETRLPEAGKVRMTMLQSVRCEDRTLAHLRVTLACLGANGKPTRFPDAILAALPADRGNAEE